MCDDGRTCPLGDAWFAAPAERPPLAIVDGTEVSLDEAVAAAATILRGARAPLVYGLGGTTIEAQRQAVALAESLGAIVDPGGAPYAYQALGASTATLGEIRDRAELVVVWRADPIVTHPRLLERLRVRSLAVVDATRTATAAHADLFVQLDNDFEALWALRAATATRAGDDEPRAEAAPPAPAHEPDAAAPPPAPAHEPDAAAPCPVAADEPRAAAPPPTLGDLARRLRDARHVAFVHGALDELSALALASLVRDLNRERHAVTLALRRDGNARGAEDVVAWQTGFAGAVSFARGHPRESAGAAALLARGDVDALLAVAAEPPAAALPTVVVGARAPASARVAITTAADGIEVAGTVHRMDGVPLPLRPLRTSDRPSVEAVLAAIGARA